MVFLLIDQISKRSYQIYMWTGKVPEVLWFKTLFTDNVFWEFTNVQTYRIHMRYMSFTFWEVNMLNKLPCVFLWNFQNQSWNTVQLDFPRIDANESTFCFQTSMEFEWLFGVNMHYHDNFLFKFPKGWVFLIP